jgi:glycosyltransferase involved in cell wall biosynthesis
MIHVPKIAVLLATLNGARFLPQQLRSLTRQSLRPNEVWVSDDGSSDATRTQVRQFADATPDISFHVLNGPGRGPAANFLHLIASVPRDTDVLLFCDQDDVWLLDRIARAASALGRYQSPMLAAGPSLICRADLTPIRASAPRDDNIGFAHALTQGVACGHALALNRAGLAAAKATAALATDIRAHDWWLYQIITGVGGQVIYDPEPQVLYRQHDANFFGADIGLRGKFRRLRALVDGRAALWTDQHLTALQRCRPMLTVPNRRLLDDYSATRVGAPLTRLQQLKTLNLHRPYKAESLALHAAILAGRY